MIKKNGSRQHSPGSRLIGRRVHLSGYCTGVQSHCCAPRRRHDNQVNPEQEGHRLHVWSYDFVIARTAEGRAFRIFNIIDEYTRECLAILVKKHITSQDVTDQVF